MAADITASIRKELRRLANKEIAEHSQRFFKTAKGQYGYGDRFLGIRVPVLRKTARKYREICVGDACGLLKSEFHEERLLALILLVNIFNRSDDEGRKTIYNIYLSNTKFVNNWDLVDCSAENIVGAYLRPRDRRPIYELVVSDELWERRIAIMSTFHFIKHNEFDDTLKIAEILLGDREDLIHKAVGWMLRETGKRDIAVEKKFLKKHYKQMPRTMLRYAIEKFPILQRRRFLKGEV